MPHTYILFGLAIKSDIVLPATPLSTLPPNHTPDVTIEYGVSPLSLENPVITNAFHQAKTDELLLLVPGVARYHIYAGRHITVIPEPGAGKEDILLFLMGSSMGALLHQRHVLVLHAGAIAAKSGAILFTGPSGIGKSTLTAALHQRGYPFLADDICAISLTGPEPAVICGFPRLKLWEDTMARLRTATEGLQRIRWDRDVHKYFVPVNTPEAAPVPVRTVVVLQAMPTNHIALIPLRGGTKIEPLLANTYRFEFLAGLGGKADHFLQCAAVAARAQVYRCIRPQHGFLLEELLDRLETVFAVTGGGAI